VTDDEAAQFRHELFKVHFPGLYDWWNTLPAPQDTWRVWRETLRPYTFEECMSVVRRWSDGTLKPFEQYERERVHLLVRAIVLRDRDLARAQESRVEHLAHVPATRSRLPSLAPVLHECVQMAGRGEDPESIEAYIAAQCPTAAAYDGPRYDCHACMDRQVVEIWHPSEVVRIVEDEGYRATRTCTVECSCSNRELAPRYARAVRYRPDRHCRVTPWDTVAAKRETLRGWLAERRKIENHPNYHHEFA
jgi:hypothetical protein